MEYLKNIAFTKVVKTNGRFREFNFRKKPGTNNPQYSIDVSNEGGVRHYFTMVKLSDNWVVCELDVPVWIREGIAHFREAIEDYES